jgi:hypothetical protein
VTGLSRLRRRANTRKRRDAGQRERKPPASRTETSWLNHLTEERENGNFHKTRLARPKPLSDFPPLALALWRRPARFGPRAREPPRVRAMAATRRNGSREVRPRRKSRRCHHPSNPEKRSHAIFEDALFVAFSRRVLSRETPTLTRLTLTPTLHLYYTFTSSRAYHYNS